ncbi:TetR/AcrR family transcriptional regulator [Paenibacillus eucommiae]|uniref:AcrR family transcriptional regulator n=1 Tax=Paenibacillus eucommiae TaxID=1355755 RepID=A0ABS4J6S9_9BACL|nr:TetR/AcrR family transcriptional regulator [Paenibacillus eucommiae]MBP1995522.1 AcrR family transcriptional regulator [Paenibacillus eucommiae]
METVTKTDRRIIRTKEAINKAFLELFSEKELEQITINDIAERANVNRGTIYLHYSDKYDLLDKCIEQHLNILITFCSKNELNREISTLVSDLKPVFDYFEANFLFFSAMFTNQRTTVFRERLLQFVATNVREKLDRQNLQPDIDNEVNAQFMASAFIGILEWWIRNEMPHSPAYMADQVRKLYEKNEVFPLLK